MTRFRVHIQNKETGERGSVVIAANTPDEANNSARKMFPAAIILKTKVDRS